MIRRKKIPQLAPTTSVSDSDLLLLTQSNITKNATLTTIKQYIANDIVHARDVQLKKGDGYIQWRYAGDSEWVDLISFADIQGPPGAGSASQTVFVGDGVKKIFEGISGAFYSDPLKYNVTVGGLIQQPIVSYTISVNEGVGYLIFDEAPPDGAPISVVVFQ